MKRRRCIVVGIDGATLSVIGPMLARGELPHFARFAARGHLGPLRSTFPPISAPAWATFMTGKNPGKHGLFDFRECRPTPRSIRPLASFRSISGPTFWEIAGHQGKRVVIVGVPMTYPPPTVEGCLVSGFPAPAGEVFTHPPDLSRRILETEGAFHFDLPWEEADSPASLIAAAATSLRNRWNVLHRVARETEWDLLVVVFTECDRLQHFLWHHHDPTHPAAPAGGRFPQAIEDHYRALDEILGRILAMGDAQTSFLLLSDHGGGPLWRKLHLNRVLEELGYLVTVPAIGLLPPPARGIDLLAIPRQVVRSGNPCGENRDGNCGVLDIFGDPRRILHQHPPGEIRLRVSLPPDPLLRGACALAPSAWERSRSPVRFRIEVVVEEAEYEVFCQELFPARRAEDRRWFEFSLPLTPFGGMAVTLLLHLESDGDPAHTPGGWANLSIVPADAPASPALPSSPPRRIDWSRTRAFAGSETEMGIYLNMEGREPEGIVPWSAYEETRAALLADLGDLDRRIDPRVWGGSPPHFTRLEPREARYHGPYVDRAPDILCMIDGMRTIAVDDLSEAYTSDPGRWTGTHRMAGIFGLLTPHDKNGGIPLSVSIEDLAPTILHLLGCRVPSGMDGRILPILGASLPSGESLCPPAAGHGGLDPEEEAALREQLVRLGYIPR
ncbi:MAG: hypothetical protein D6795_19825 [Deltaproteobacteria bacterium]|nr:MAG: hypothetical protein D6795_19825 [Deltaproteobacteria bacterium]